VDLRSVNAKFKAAGIVGSLSRPSTSKAGPWSSDKLWVSRNSGS
jgi:hypothetical protein